MTIIRIRQMELGTLFMNWLDRNNVWFLSTKMVEKIDFAWRSCQLEKINTVFEKIKIELAESGLI